jgi:exodeoxyribonuclease-3
MKTMKLVSWNVNGIRAAVKKGLSEIIKDLDPDIFCIQETKAQDQDVMAIASSIFGYELYLSSAVKKGYSGTAILTREKPSAFVYGMGLLEHDQEGRVITLEYGDFYLVNTYVPNSGQELKRLNYRSEWDLNLLEFLKKLDEKKPVIFTGDLNVAHEPIDLARPAANYNKTAGYTQVEIDGFKNLIQAGFIDTFRKFYPDKVQYSYWNQRFNARAVNLGWRIDYFLVSERIIDKISDAFILDDVMGSDHCPVGIKISL